MDGSSPVERFPRRILKADLWPFLKTGGRRSSHLARVPRLSALRRLTPRLRWDDVPSCDVLVLAATYGNGHIQAGRALMDAVVAADPQVRAHMVDYFELIHPVLNAATRAAYVYSVRNAPTLWREFYLKTSQISPDSFWQQRLFHLGSIGVKRMLAASGAQVVVATHPTPAGVVAELLRDGEIRGVTAITVVTDFILHSQWVHPWTSVYVVASDEVAADLVNRGIPADRIRVTGIPLRRQFSGEMPDPPAVRRRMGLDPSRPLVLVLTGAYGMMRGAVGACRRLAHLTAPIQLVIVTGYDEHLRAALEDDLRGSPNPVRVLGYVEDVHELMAASDVLVTKAGGLTVSEALALGSTIVIYAPIPGQEEGNADYLERSGAGLVASRPESLARAVQALVLDPARRRRMAERARRLGHPDAAAQAASLVLESVPR